MLKTKNKKSAVLLVAFVAVIWGTIAYKIIKQLYFPDGVEQTSNGFVAKESKKETAALRYSLAYADPFLKFKSSSAALARAEPSNLATFAVKEPVVEKPKPAVVQPDGLTFIGWVSNNHRTLKEAVVLHNGVTHILEVGEELNGFKVVQVFADSLVVSREGNRFCLKKQS